MHLARSAGPLVLGGMLMVACDRPSTERVGVTELVEPALAGSEAHLASPAPQAPQLAPDLDVPALHKRLSCARTHNACRVLHDFGEATRGLGQLASGQGRWLGRGYRVEHGREVSDLFVLSAAGVPPASVGPTDLPLRIALGNLPREARRDGEKLAKALVHSEQVANTNKALPLVKGWVSDNGRIAMPTDGPSVRLISEDATYVRQAGQKVIVVRLKAPAPGVPPSPGDGTYAELWPVTW